MVYKIRVTKTQVQQIFNDWIRTLHDMFPQKQPFANAKATNITLFK